MQDDSRIDVFRRMLERNPEDTRALFGLALEYEKREAWPQVVSTLRDYLARTDDEGNAWGRLGAALHRMGDVDGAREAYRRGIDAANRHGHPSMAAEFEETIEYELD